MIRKAVIKDAKKIHKIINKYAAKNLMLPRGINSIYENLRDYYVVEIKKNIIGCCGLHISWENLAEIKSLVVEEKYRKKNYGRALVAKCLGEAKKLQIPKVFTLTFIPEFFKKLKFKPIDKNLLPHKVWTECVNCPQFPKCGETALMITVK